MTHWIDCIFLNLLYVKPLNRLRTAQLYDHVKCTLCYCISKQLFFFACNVWNCSPSVDRVKRDVSLVNQKYIVMVRILSLVYSIYISKKSCIEKDCPHINSSCFIIHEIIRYYLFTKVIWKTRFLILVCFLYVMNFFKTPWWSFLKVPMVIWYMWKIFQLYLTVDFFKICSFQQLGYIQQFFIRCWKSCVGLTIFVRIFSSIFHRKILIFSSCYM